jgi:hypothetical protein
MTWSTFRDGCKRYGWQVLVAVPLLILVVLQLLGRLFRKSPDLVDAYIQEREQLSKELLEKERQAVADKDASVAQAEKHAEHETSQEIVREQQHTEQVVEDPAATNEYLHAVGNKIRGG